MKNILKTTLIIFLFPVVSLFSQDTLRNEQELPMPKKGICAHRGANETHPENTIAAFEEAVRLGAQMVEFDVRMTKDNRLVVIHDASVDRTTNGTGSVADLTWAEIKKLDAGSWKAKEFKGEKISLLKTVLASFPKNVWLNVHLKGDEKLGKAVATVIMSENRAHQVIIACAKESAIGVRKVDSHIRICNMERKRNRKNYVKKTIKGEFSTLQFIKKRDDSSFANDIIKLRKHGIRINYHFSNTAEEGIELFDMGVDFILTNQLETMLQAAETAGIPRLIH